MLKAGVIGHPISHSKSPLIHRYWLKQYEIDGEYKTYDIKPDDLEGGIRNLVDLGLKGFNVTIPHKQKIMALCNTISEEAKAIGAVNTVVVDHAGHLHGYNTDAFGFSQNLNETIADFDWKNIDACIIGAGGAARAVMYALACNKAKHIRLTNRTEHNAQKLSEPYQSKVILWSDRQQAITGSNLIINTTSLGMNGQDSLDIDLTDAQNNAVVYDIVYAPLMTPLLQQAATRNMKVVTGIGMLLHQARPAFELWFGKLPFVTKELELSILG